MFKKAGKYYFYSSVCQDDKNRLIFYNDVCFASEGLFSLKPISGVVLSFQEISENQYNRFQEEDENVISRDSSKGIWANLWQ